jgi:hypothetical protein
MKGKIIFPALFLIINAISFNVNSQINEVDFIKGGVNDAQLLFKEYLTPYANILGANLNGGWYNTAKPHKSLGFDVTISVSAAWAPTADRTFDLAAMALQGSPLGSSTITPTIAGASDDNRPELRYATEYASEEIEIARFRMPNGTGVNTLPLPMGQLGIGLPFGTEITGRYLPNIDFGNAGNIGLWGVGIKHSIIQWIPGLKRLPILDITAQGGYTKLLTYANLVFTPEDLDADDLTSPDPFRYKGQRLEMGVEAFTVNLIVSQTLPVITFYQGIGYSSSNTNIALIGNFPFLSLDNSGNKVVTDNDIISDPFNAEIQNTKDLRLNAGVRIKLGVFTIHADYTKANYSVATAGVGISFR